LSQMRSMLIPLWFIFPFAGDASFGLYLVWGSIEQCAAPWQAAAHGGRITKRPVSPAPKTAQLSGVASVF